MEISALKFNEILYFQKLIRNFAVGGQEVADGDRNMS